MGKIDKLFLLLFLISLLGCTNTKDCPTCFTPPNFYVFDLVDTASGENIFSQGVYSVSEISFLDTGTGKEKSFDFIAEDQRNLIVLNSIGWESENLEIEVKHSDDVLFHLKIEVERKSENCCSFTQEYLFEISGVSYERDNTKELITIFL